MTSIAGKTFRLGLLGGTALVALAAAGPAFANDATAELGAGGLQLVYNSAIEMRSEDLRISATEVHVTYHFMNTTKAPVTVTVAFPLPALDTEGNEDYNVVLPNPDSDNFVNFALTVNGQAQTPSIYSRASALGIDRTDVLRQYNIPLIPASEATYDALSALPAAALDELARDGLILREDWGILPSWKLETSFYWEQTFPPGQDVTIEHSYAPVVGYGFFGDYDFTDQAYVDRYCMDDTFMNAARTLMGPNADFPYLNEQRLEYILTTANTWAAPIHDFHLTVDKGATNALVSFCGDGVTKTSPTTFEVHQTDFVPDQELNVLIVQPAAP